MALSRRHFVWILARTAALGPLAACSLENQSGTGSNIDPVTGDGGSDDGKADGGADEPAQPPDTGDDEPALPPILAQPRFEFLHGVASGDPLTERVILWTRVTPYPASAGGLDPNSKDELSLDFVLATDPALEQVVGKGRASTSSERDFTVKLDASGLTPNTPYYYQFFDPARPDVRSPIGRTRTLPAGSVERARLAFVSCACYALGYFHTYRDIAARSDLDAVLHLGDYIYEYGPDTYQDDTVRRPHDPAHEIITLADYRTRHAQYKTDPDLQEAHRQHPFITIWDDHETANDAWRDGAENHTEGTEGSYADRRRAALTAYHEWMPIRDLDSTDLTKIYRTFRFGDLCDLIMLETRTKRDKQDLNQKGSPGRTLLGNEEAVWLEGELRASFNRGTAWRVLGQQVMFGQLHLFGRAVNADQWDGYEASRNRLLDFVNHEGIDNLVILTGDIHSAWAMDVSNNPYDPASYDAVTGKGALAVEFVCTSITSPALETLGALGNLVEGAAIQSVLNDNPHMKYVDIKSHGYCLLDITATRIQNEWHNVTDIKSESGQAHSFARAFSVESGVPHVVESTMVSEPIPGRAPLV
jgi:alkaline phosphatase D